ncbi:SAM-dependent methyltransferase [Streptacidiphilus sp. P02-A3a]|uniref:SAM-dependent methyltransferase n=1 Tax=Streptacidiphilus sp. P02-A3a TaxID=2704468 RepID=UPI001CDCCAA8|nr:SAM-dependent methyltransferase [Streptacidiphilus sp. P02-A3a]
MPDEDYEGAKLGSFRTEDGWTPPLIDTSVPHSARMYDYFLGGKDNFAVDRAAGDRVIQYLPSVRSTVQANRRFLGRAVRFAAQQGIRQFLDIGTGIPTVHNTHQAAQAVNPDAHVVYVDNDPIVLVHARALLRGTTQGRTAYVEADFRDPQTILDSPQAKELLDFTQPIALMVVSLLHFFPDSEGPDEILNGLKAVLPPGSALILSHATADFTPPDVAEAVIKTYTSSGMNLTSRNHAEILRFFDGLELVSPGLVPVHEWNPEEEADLTLDRAENAGYGGVALKLG